MRRLVQASLSLLAWSLLQTSPASAQLKGEATWGSGSRTHTGELDYDAKPSADKMKFGDGTDELDCQVTMQLVGKHLVVGDNLHCGGANVSFSGVYQKRPKR